MNAHLTLLILCILGGASVGEEALQVVEGLPSAGVAPAAIGREMPKQPFPGQKKPPCEPRTQRVINGACWVGPIRNAKPPCGNDYYDGEDGCYVPLIASPRQPTAEQP